MKLSMVVLILPMTSSALRRVGTRAWQRFLIARFPGVQDLVVYLHRHRKDSWAQWMGCMVLQNMCMDNTENRRIAGEQGAIQAVVDALNRHRENKWVQASGCLALAIMCGANTENKRIAREQGAIQAVVDVWNRHRENKWVQANKRIAREQGAIQAIVDALNRHRETVVVQSSGCLALANMCNDNTENKRIVDASGQTLRDIPSIRARLDSQVGPVRDFFFG